MKKLGIFIMFLVLTCLVGRTAHADLTDGLVAYYPFDGDASDYSGYNNHPTYVGATLTDDRFGNTHSAYSFDGGSNSYIEVYYSTSVNGDIYTISCWVSFYTFDQNHPVMDKRNSPHDRNFGLYYFNDDSEPTYSTVSL